MTLPSRARLSIGELKKDLRQVAVTLIALLLLGALLVSIQAISGWMPSVLHALVADNAERVVLVFFPSKSDYSDPVLKGLGFDPDNDYKLREPALAPHCRLEYLPEADNEDEAERDLKARLRSSPEVVAVIAHEASTKAKTLIRRVYASDEFLQGEDPIPLILPMVTNPDITTGQENHKKHILRLPESDRKQVVTIALLLKRLRPVARRILLVVDSTNQVYARYIARELLSNYQFADLPIVDSVGVDLDSGGFFSPHLFACRPDTIVFIGMSSQASLFLRRYFPIPSQKPDASLPTRLVFTDGAAGKNFESLCREVLSVRKDLDIFLTGPFPTTAPLGARSTFPTFQWSGQVARSLAQELVNRAELAGRLDRKNVREILQKICDGQEIVAGGQLQFDPNGDSLKGGTMHAYHILADQVQHWEVCPCQ